MGLIIDQWQGLAERYAPQLLLAEGEAPATPLLTADGVSAEASKPVVYYLPTHARVQGQSLIQLVYFLWFKGDAQQPLKGRLWRVTLDANGDALAYDTVNAAGFDHQWFTAQTMTPRHRELGELHQPAVGQAVSDPRRMAIPLEAAGQTVRSVQALPKATTRKTYQLLEYEDLLTLPAPGGGTRSLFDESGSVPGTASTDPLLRDWGLTGALRQWGHHATSLTAQLYFDAPTLLDRTFLMGREQAAR